MNVRSTVRLLTLLGLAAAPAREHAGAQGAAGIAGLGLSGLEGQLVEKRRELDAQRARHEALAAELAALPRVRATLEASLRRDVRMLYRLQRSGLLPLAGGLSSLMSHASRVAHLTRMAQRTQSELDVAQHSSLKLVQDAGESEAQVAALERELAALEEERARLEAEQSLADAPSGPALATAAAGSRVTYGLTVVGGGEHPESFTRQRGDLALPVAGAARFEPSANGKGLTLSASPGVSVRAAADGRVAAVEPDGAGGMRVVVAHDRPYRTIYAGLQSVDVQPGDAVSKSARLGAAGASPLTFDVQSEQRSLDARIWLGL